MQGVFCYRFFSEKFISSNLDIWVTILLTRDYIPEYQRFMVKRIGAISAALGILINFQTRLVYDSGKQN